MRRVALIRHAKAAPHTSAAKDHERPLDGRGPADAKHLGRRLAAAGYRPDLTLCSSARRAQQTLARIDGAFDPPLRVFQEARIYEAPAERILELIQHASPEIGFLALVGHNPGLEDATRLLLDEEGRNRWEARGGAMPTCCAAILEGDAATWRDIVPGSMRLVQVMTPGDKAD